MSQVLWAPRRTVALWGKSEKGLLRCNAPESCNEPTSKSAPPTQHMPTTAEAASVVLQWHMETKNPRWTMTSPEVAFQVVKPRPENWGATSSHWESWRRSEIPLRKKAGGWGQESDKSEDIKPVVQGCPSTCCTELGRVPHPQIHVHQQPQKVTLFGNRVLADVKLSYHHAGLGWAQIQWLGHLETHGCTGDSRDRVWKMQLQAKKYLGLLASTRS